MQITAKIIAELLGGEVEGDPNVVVSRPSKIEEGGEGTISFLSNPKYEPFVYSTTASILLVSRDFRPAKPVKATLVRVDDVYSCIAKLFESFGNPAAFPSGISSQAAIHDEASLGKNVAVGAFCVVEKGAVIGDNCILFPQVYVGPDVRIGSDCILFPGVKVHHSCRIGNNCTLHAGAVIGSDGFGFAPQPDGTYKKIQQLGNVVLEDHVDIGAHTVIDRATMGSTLIREGVKLDNLIQVAHNVEIGKHTAMAAQAGIAGSTKIGKHVQVGGQVGFAGHIEIADGTKFAAKAGVAHSVETPNTSYFGIPILPLRSYVRAFNIFKQLPELLKRLEALEASQRQSKGKGPS